MRHSTICPINIASNWQMACRWTNRRSKEIVFYNEHLKMNKLKRKKILNKYLYKEIPPYPKPEFHAFRIKHDTNVSGLKGIKSDTGFRGASGEKGISLLWWSLAVGPEEIQSAEKRLMETTYPDQREQKVGGQSNFLSTYTTSPVFLQTSMWGSFRFTFLLEDILKAYREQFCDGEDPAMRVYCTSLFTQQVQYTVLVHSPANNKCFSEYDLLGDDPQAICGYREGCFVWRSEAMCGTHRYELKHAEKQLESEQLDWPEFYVWDHMAIALHVEKDQVLTFGSLVLRENLRFCTATPGYLKKREHCFIEFNEAQQLVYSLWEGTNAPLEKHSWGKSALRGRRWKTDKQTMPTSAKYCTVKSNQTP